MRGAYTSLQDSATLAFSSRHVPAKEVGEKGVGVCLLHISALLVSFVHHCVIKAFSASSMASAISFQSIAQFSSKDFRASLQASRSFALIFGISGVMFMLYFVPSLPSLEVIGLDDDDEHAGL